MRPGGRWPALARSQEEQQGNADGERKGRYERASLRPNEGVFPLRAGDDFRRPVDLRPIAKPPWRTVAEVDVQHARQSRQRLGEEALEGKSRSEVVGREVDRRRADESATPTRLAHFGPVAATPGQGILAGELRGEICGQGRAVPDD